MFIYRKATLKDSPEIEFLMNLSINEIIGKIVDESQLEAAKESMGLDTQLVEDGSYFLVFEKDTSKLVACSVPTHNPLQQTPLS